MKLSIKTQMVELKLLAMEVRNFDFRFVQFIEEFMKQSDSQEFGGRIKTKDFPTNIHLIPQNF